YLQGRGRHVVLIDNNESNVSKAKEENIEAYNVNIYTDDLADQFELLDMGYMISMTSSSDINNYAVRKYHKIFGENGSFRLLTPDELKRGREELPQQGIFSYTDDFLNLNEIARDFPLVHETEVNSKEEVERILDRTVINSHAAPLFLLSPNGNLEPIPHSLDDYECEEGVKIVYLGRKLENASIEEVLGE
ncbi:MAG: NAD-binding protein, partial [Mameliella sp.]|nr:NAD-binding protein [Phaeodactylibacter sp.]